MKRTQALIASLIAIILLLCVALIFSLRQHSTTTLPFDISPEEMAQHKAQVEKISCVGNVKDLGLTALHLAQNNPDERFPDISTPSAIQANLGGHTLFADSFVCPTTKQPYLGNPSISGKKASNFYDQEDIVIFYDASDAHEGGRSVVFMNGSARWLSAAEWQAAKKRSGVP